VLYEPREHRDLVRVLLHQVWIAGGSASQIHLLLAEEPAVDQGKDIFSL
jgi:hypothetical protein